MLCNPKEESRTSLDSTKQYKGRRGLKDPRRPAGVELLTLFRENRPTPPTTRASAPSLLLPNFQTGYVEGTCYGLSAGRTRRQKPAFDQKMALLQASGTSLPTVSHDSPAERPRNFETLRGLPRHILLHSLYWSLGPNFSTQEHTPECSSS